MGVLIPYRVPSYCTNCGEPYPWTHAKLEAVEELIRLNENLSSEEKEQFASAVREASKDTRGHKWLRKESRCSAARSDHRLMT